MPLPHILGTDHVVITVRDLDAAAKVWEGLGFTLSPRGTHSPHLGTGNYTMMFQADYLELLGVLAPTDQNKPTRDFLAMREGIERTAFTTDNAAKGAAMLKARGLEPLGPVHFGRPVDLPGGGTGEAKFNVFRWPLLENPGGMRIFACEHLTRDTVWIPELMTHANGTTAIASVEILSADAKAAAEHMSRLIDEPVLAEDGLYKVPSGGERADFLFLDGQSFATRYPATVRQGAASEGAVALTLVTDSLAKVRALPGAILNGPSVSLPASAANGVVLNFIEG